MKQFNARPIPIEMASDSDMPQTTSDFPLKNFLKLPGLT